MSDLNPDLMLAATNGPRSESIADQRLKLGQIGYVNTQAQLGQAQIAAAQQKAQTQQLISQAITTAQNAASAVPGTTADALGVNSRPLINRTGAPVDGAPTLGGIGAAPPAVAADQPATSQPQPVHRVIDNSPGAVTMRAAALLQGKIPDADFQSFVKSGMDAQKLETDQLNLATARRSAQDQDIENEQFAKTPDDPKATVKGMVAAGASPARIAAFEDRITAVKTHYAGMQKEMIENSIKAGDALRGALQSFAQLDPLAQHEQWPDFVKQQEQNGHITPEEVANVPPAFPGNAQLKIWGDQHALATQLAKEELDKRNGDRAQAAADETARHNQAMENQAATPKTDPELALAAAGGDPAKAMKMLTDQKIAVRPVTNITTGPGATTEDDFKREGEQYARTGVMPSLGMGGGSARTKIIHYANEFARDSGLSPSEVVSMRAAYSGDKNSLKTFTAQRDQIASFESTANKNIDLFLDAASKVPDTGSQWINLPLRKVDEKLVGSANVAALNAARAVATNEIAKVTSGGSMSGVLSDAARQEVKDYNPESATFAQTLKVVKILKQDMANRHASMDATIEDIRGRLGGSGTAAAPQPAAHKVGDVVTVRGKKIKISAIHSDGTFDGDEVAN